MTLVSRPLLPSVKDRKGGAPLIYDDIEPLRAKETVMKWLLNLKEGTGRKTATYSFARYLRWRKEKGLESDPDVMISECLDGTARVHIKHLETVLQYCQSMPDCAPSTKMRAYKTVRSFYEGNRIALPKAKFRVSDNGGEGGGRQVKVKGETTAFEFLGMVRRALDFCKVRDRAMILCTLQGGMDDSTFAEAFNHVGFPQLAKHFGSEDWRCWDSSKSPARIILVRPKSGYRFYTFVDVDGVEALKQWLDVRPGSTVRIRVPDDPSLVPSSDPMFLTRDGRPIRPQTVSNVYREVGKRAAVNVPGGARMGQFKGARIRYPFHSHEVRDTLVTLARSCKADVEVAQFLTGHDIDDLKYDKSAWNDVGFFRNEYLKIARPALNPVSGRVLEAEKEISKRFEDRLTKLEQQIEDTLSKARA
jgi:hypothetical protein